MTDDCTVMRPTEVRGDAGGVSLTWALQGALKCRLRSGAGIGTGVREQLMAGRLTPIAVYTVYVPVGSDVQAKDRLIVKGRTLEVHGVLDASNASAVPCVCSEVA
ncbi:MAG TPA: head-tail adaptor protein [Anaerolineales bacterium]|nr:head-tail adaptor protein [Anaerolineales bacterium]